MKNWAKVEDGIVVNIVSSYENPGGYIEYSPTGEFRKTYAMIGGSYNSDLDIFINPKPYESWILNESHDWEPPTIKPVKEGFWYIWNEINTSWDEYEKVDIEL
jgi:hypothetical protein